MAAFDTLISHGWSVAYALAIEGVPWLMAERSVLRADAETALAASGYEGVCPALLIPQGESIVIELDREEGIARGRAITVELSADRLEDDGLSAALFARPSRTARVEADADHDAATFTVDGTSGWSGGDYGYIGRECISIGAIAAGPPRFTGCTRGVVGWPYTYRAATPSSHRWITDRPLVWRGRLATLWAVPVSPEGRAAGSSWISGDYARALWRGYVDAPPQRTAAGFALRLQPLVRLLGQELGWSAEYRLPTAAWVGGMGAWGSGATEAPLLYPGPDARQVYVAVTWTTGGGGSDAAWIAAADPWSGGDYDSLIAWVTQLAAAINDWAIAAGYPVRARPRDGQQMWTADMELVDPGGTVTGEIYVPAETGPFFLLPARYAIRSLDWGADGVSFRAMTDWTGPCWIVVEQTGGEEWQDADPPTAGLGTLKAGDGDAEELVRWDEATAVSSDPPRWHLRLSERGLAGTPIVNAFQAGATLRTGTGHEGALATALLSALESSGGAGLAGTRGTYDTMDLGLGLAVPSEYIEESTFTSQPEAQGEIAVARAGSSSVADLLGGALALRRLCVSQGVGSLGSALRLVSTRVGVTSTVDPDAVAIEAQHVMLEAAAALDVADAPNEVRVEGVRRQGHALRLTVRDVPRIQQEGVRSWKLDAAGGDAEEAQAHALGLIAQGDGQTALSLSIAPWLDVWPGDRARVTAAHPLMWDWATGSTSPVASVTALVAGVEWDLATLARRVTLLLDGQSQPTLALCPTGTVTAINGGAKTITLSTGEGGWFRAGDSVEIYEPGDDETDRAEDVVVSVSGDTLTMTTALPAWLGAGDRVTYPVWASATTAQREYMHVRASQRWGP